MQYSFRPRPADESELKTELIRNAAFVAHEGLKAKELQAWLDEDPDQRRVVYVFDTDVLVAHCAPWLNGPASDEKSGRGYGQVLPLRPISAYPAGDRLRELASERRKAESVCWLLADKALGRARARGTPFLQLKPHFDETFRIYSAVKRNAGAEAAVARISAQQRDRNVTAQMLAFVSRAVLRERWDIEGNPGRFLSIVLNRMQSGSIQQASRYVREWDSFLALFRDNSGIFDLLEFAPEDATFGTGQREAWIRLRNALGDTAGALDEVRQRRKGVFQELIAPERYRFRRERLTVDVDALEMLASANTILEASGGDTVRLVLVTGDRKTTLALANTKAELPGSRGRSIREFARRHVHHLWSFVDDITSDAEEGRPEVRRSELFSGLLAARSSTEAAEPPVDLLARWAVSADAGLARHIQVADIEQSYARWDEYSEGAANLHRHFLVDPSKVEAMSKILMQKFKASGSELPSGKLQDMAIETMARARDRTNVQFSEIGANSILEAHRLGIRNPPDLVFDSLRAADGIFKDLALSRRVFTSAGEFAARFNRISEDCYQPSDENAADDDHRQECYIKYLVLGTLFASANRWLVAEQHAESAYDIVVRARRLHDPIRTRTGASGHAATVSGREALYLQSVARRLRAEDLSDYDRAEEALDGAIAALLADREAGTAAGVPEIRFDCERLALALARYYHVQASDGADPGGREASEVFRTAGRLLAAVSPGVPFEPAHLDLMPVGTRTAIATNLLQVAVIARGDGLGREGRVTPDRHVSMAEVEAALRLLERDTDLDRRIWDAMQLDGAEPPRRDPEVICSPLMMLYAVVARLLARDQHHWRPNDAEEVEKLFGRRNAAVTAYDGWRFKALQDIAIELLPPAAEPFPAPGLPTGR